MKTKKWKRTAAWLLTGIFFIGAAGCTSSEGDAVSNEGTDSPKEDQEIAKGRYVETLKETPEGVNTIEAMVRLSDGSAAFINPDTGKLHMSKDNGDSWETRELPALANQVIKEEIEITSTAIAPDGGVFFSYVDWSNPQDASGGSEEGDQEVIVDEEDESSYVKEHYIYIDKDGNDSELSLKDESGSFDFYLSNAVFIEDNVLAGHMNGGTVYRMDLEAQTINSVGLSTDMTDTLFVAGDYLLSKEVLYQFSAGSSLEDSVLSDFIEKETQGSQTMAVCSGKEENTLYLASASGLYSHVIGGSAMEELLDGGLSNLGDPTKSAVSILENEDGSFLIAYEDGEIDLYTYDSEAPAVPTQQITIYSLEQNMTVSKAVSSFRKSHPDIYVKQEIGLSGDYGVTQEDAIRNLNTRLLAGEGPDVLLLDEMPLDAYIEKNMLADLSGLAEKLEEKNEYFSNIFKAYQTDGGLFTMPMRFQIPILLGEKGTAGDISDMAALAETVKKAREEHPNSNTLLGTYTAEELLKRLYMAASASLQQKETLDKDAIKEFLTQASAIYQEEQKNITDVMLQRHNESLVWMEGYGIIDEMEKFGVDTSAVFDIMAGDQALLLGKLNGMSDFQMLNAIPHNKENMTYGLISGPSGSLFIPNGIVGINGKSGEMDLAEAFVQELFSVDVQKADLSDGFPVNADSYDLFTENPNPNSQLGFSAAVADEDGGVESRVDFLANWPEADEIAALKDRIGTLSQPSLSDGIIYTAVIESGIKVLEGDLTIDEGCDEIAQKVELYLAE